MLKAHTRHILVPEEQRCLELKERIENGEDFADLARRYSHCPSGHNGGDLGKVSEGQMVPQFDEVAFGGELNKIHGPVRTQFGYHLIEVLNRAEGKDSALWTRVWQKCQAGLRTILSPRPKTGPWG